MIDHFDWQHFFVHRSTPTQGRVKFAVVSAADRCEYFGLDQGTSAVQTPIEADSVNRRIDAPLLLP